MRNRWQFWGLVLAVLLIVISPSLGGDPDWELATKNAAVVGMLLICLAGFELARHHRWTDVGQLMIGLWLTGSPHLLGYQSDGFFMRWHGTIGVVLAVLALFSLFQLQIRKLLRR